MWGFGRATPAEAAGLPPLALAYLGDAVYELYVRDRLLQGPVSSQKELHKAAVGRVRASAQAAALRRMAARLTEQEADIVRRGRNARVQAPKGADLADHHYSTAFEALIGYLHLTGQRERINEVLDLAFTTAAAD